MKHITYYVVWDEDKTRGYISPVERITDEICSMFELEGVRYIKETLLLEDKCSH